jgi:hypothetical protein
MAQGEVQCDPGAHRAPGQRDFSGDADGVEQLGEVVGQQVEGRRRAQLFRHARAAPVVAQHAPTR